MKNIEPRRIDLLLIFLVLVSHIEKLLILQKGKIYVETKNKQHKRKKYWETEYNLTDSMGSLKSRMAHAK